MIFWKNQPLAIAPHLAGSVEALADMPRPTFALAARDPKAATLELSGVLDPDYLAEWRAAFLAMAASDKVSRIVLAVDSPGGMVFGVPETAAVVNRVAKVKRVEVVAQNYLASGAYWIASQANSITCSPSCYVGSCGVIFVVLDETAAAEMMGVRVLTITSGPVKGVGVPGAPVEPEHIAMYRRLCDYTCASFMADVERGRKLKPAQTAKIFTGEVWHGNPAKTLGLVDKVAIFEDRVDELMGAIPAAKPYSDLYGQAALDKMQELVLAEGPDWDAAEARLNKRYPELAVAVSEAEASPLTSRNVGGYTPSSGS